MRKPPHNEQKEFEQVGTSDWVNGQIIEIEIDEQHPFIHKGETDIRAGIRFILKLQEYKDKHYSPPAWMTFSYDRRAKLYKVYLAHLVEGCKPYMDFDIDLLLNMSVKTMWKGEGYQEIELIRPVTAKIMLSEGESMGSSTKTPQNVKERLQETPDIPDNEQDDIPF